MYRKAFNIVLILISVLFYSCSTGPEPINYGKDQCEQCRMTIMDNQFGAEIITNKGKIYKFDAAECMIRYLNQGKISYSDVDKFLVIDASKPGQFTDARKAYYMISEKFRSPMGAGLSAFGSLNDAETFSSKYEGVLTHWEGILERLQPKTQ